MEVGAGAASSGFTGTFDSFQLLTEMHTGQSTGCAWRGSATVAFDRAIASMDTQKAHHRRARWKRGRQSRRLAQQGCLGRPRPAVPRI